jgi:hypothetical protein
VQLRLVGICQRDLRPLRNTKEPDLVSDLDEVTQGESECPQKLSGCSRRSIASKERRCGREEEVCSQRFPNKSANLVVVLEHQLMNHPIFSNIDMQLHVNFKSCNCMSTLSLDVFFFICCHAKTRISKSDYVRESLFPAE